MEVEYTLQPEDFRAFTRYYRTLPSGRTTFSPLAVLGVVVIMVAWGLALLIAAFFFESGGLAVGMLIGSLWATLLQGWLQARNNRAMLQARCEDPRSEWALRNVRVVISPDQLLTVARGATSNYEWLRVWHIGITDRHVFLCITRDTAIILPRRAFPNDTHFEQFVTLVRQYRQGQEPQAPKPIGIITALPPQPDALTRADVP